MLLRRQALANAIKTGRIMKLIKIIVTLACLLGVAPGLHAAATCNASITPSTPSAEFTDHGNGTVTHSRTGLMWQRCAEGQTWSAGTCTGSASSMSWGNSLKLAVSATTGGYSDWRVPNIKELRTIVEDRCYNPSINDSIFPNTPASGFWSASASADNSGSAWFVNFAWGNASGGYRKSDDGQVRLVRAGQPFDSFDGLNASGRLQTIGAITLSTSLVVGGTTTASASASSGLQVTFSVSSPTICTVSGTNSRVVTGIAAGICVINAYQAGDLSYAPARQVTLMVSVALGRTAPGAPSIQSITAGPGRVTITLLAPNNTGGSLIVAYSATCRASGHPSVTATSTTTTVVVPGLVPGISYACTATASNGSYTSLATPASAPVIPKPKAALTPILMLLLD
jgi:hypothetical protein